MWTPTPTVSASLRAMKGDAPYSAGKGKGDTPFGAHKGKGKAIDLTETSVLGTPTPPNLGNVVILRDNLVSHCCRFGFHDRIEVSMILDGDEVCKITRRGLQLQIAVTPESNRVTGRLCTERCLLRDT